MTIKIGIGLPNQVRGTRPTVIPEWAVRAEGAGFSALGSVGRVAYPGVMDTVALAAAAGATKSIGLFPMSCSPRCGRRCCSRRRRRTSTRSPAAA